MNKITKCLEIKTFIKRKFYYKKFLKKKIISIYQ